MRPALQAAGLGWLEPRLFEAAGVADWLARPPDTMVDERPVALLHQAVRRLLPPAVAAAVLDDAGRRTADYLLAVRIPRAAQIVLRLLPRRLAAGLLVRAIRAHAWTFAGSGRLSARAGVSTVFDLADNPFCAGESSSVPVCAWHAAVFRRLFQALVSPAMRVDEVECAASGGARCRFVIR